MRAFLFAFMSVVTVGAVTVYDLVLDEWRLYKSVMKRSFDSVEEEHLRLRTFVEAKDLVARHNERFSKGLEDYELSINRFADKDLYEDVDLEEMSKRFMEDDEVALLRNDIEEIVMPPDVKLPDFVDWNASGAVNEVVDQKSCGSCYAIASTETLEAQIFISNGTLSRLSFQQIVDCSESFGNSGCNGGTYSNTFRYLKSTGLAFYDDYPYDNKKGVCRIKGKKKSLPVKKFYYTKSKNEDVLKYAVAKFGPVAAAINSRPRSLQLYKSGIYSNPKCKPILSHAVLITGYGTDEKTKKDYWIIKNSWGKWWGDNGYLKLARNENMCGINTLAYVAKVV